jgi:uncharacterized protein YcnI
VTDCRRVLTRGFAAASVGSVLCLGSAVGAPSAWAHVHVSGVDAVRSGTAIVTFEVPNESETGAATTELSVTLPDVASARTDAMPGWTAKLDRDTDAGTVRSVTWTAADGGIGVDQFGLFRISMTLPDTDTVTFPAAQKYADGTVVRWDQPPLPDGGEPEHPVPTLALEDGPADPAAVGQLKGHKFKDNPARLLAGAALVVAGTGLGVAVIRRRT